MRDQAIAITRFGLRITTTTCNWKVDLNANYNLNFDVNFCANTYTNHLADLNLNVNLNVNHSGIPIGEIQSKIETTSTIGYDNYNIYDISNLRTTSDTDRA